MLIGLKNNKLGLNSARRLHIEGVPMLGHRKRVICPSVLVCSTNPLQCSPTKVGSALYRLGVSGTRGVGGNVSNPRRQAICPISIFRECAVRSFATNSGYGLHFWVMDVVVHSVGQVCSCAIEKCKQVEGNVIKNVK
jgi:hypothetical protein